MREREGWLDAMIMTENVDTARRMVQSASTVVQEVAKHAQPV
jgi:hypothetical protein